MHGRKHSFLGLAQYEFLKNLYHFGGRFMVDLKTLLSLAMPNQ